MTGQGRRAGPLRGSWRAVTYKVALGSLSELLLGRTSQCRIYREAVELENERLERAQGAVGA